MCHLSLKPQCRWDMYTHLHNVDCWNTCRQLKIRTSNPMWYLTPTIEVCAWKCYARMHQGWRPPGVRKRECDEAKTSDMFYYVNMHSTVKFINTHLETGPTKPVPWLMLPWLLVSPNYQQLYQRLCRISRSLFSTRRNLNYLCHLGFDKPFNSFGPSDAICRQRSRSRLAQVMACCLTTPSHYLNQCWLITSMV